MLNTSYTPYSNICSISSNFYKLFNNPCSVFLYKLPLIIITIFYWKWRMLIWLASQLKKIINSPLIIWRLNHEHWCFEIFGWIYSIETFYDIPIILLYALGNAKVFGSVWYLHYRCTQLSHRLSVSNRTIIICDENPTVRHHINFWGDSIVIEIVWPKESCNSTSRWPWNYYCVLIKKVICFVQIAKLFHHIIFTSKIEVGIFVRNWLNSCALVFTSITVNYVYFCPIVEYIILFLERRHYPLTDVTSLRWINCGATKFTFACFITIL